jgi:hypothetical protein
MVNSYLDHATIVNTNVPILLFQLSSWSDLNHLFVDEQDKEHFKAIFGYSSVPFYALFDHVSHHHKVPAFLILHYQIIGSFI